jgi:hypothetical protein
MSIDGTESCRGLPVDSVVARCRPSLVDLAKSF